MLEVLTTAPKYRSEFEELACPKCGGSKPTCCSCPEPKQFSLTEIVEEFTQSAIMAHVGYGHGYTWARCQMASCSERKEMIEFLSACH